MRWLYRIQGQEPARVVMGHDSKKATRRWLEHLVAGAGFEPTTSGHPFQILVSRGHTLYHPSSNPIFRPKQCHSVSRKIT